jgi:hypothetical protein
MIPETDEKEIGFTEFLTLDLISSQHRLLLTRKNGLPPVAGGRGERE